MPIFRLEDDELVIAQETNLELESQLEDWLENSPLALAPNEFILWIDRQTRARDEEGTIYSDLLGVDDQGNLVIVELKKGQTSRDVVTQLLDYAAWADRLSESRIRGIAEAYFEKRDGFQGKIFDNAFREVFDMPETEEIPPLNRALRLFIAAEEIPSRVGRVCRLLRTSYGMDITCIEISPFETKSGEVLVNMERTVGDEDFAAPKAQQPKTASPPSQWSGDKPVKQVVWEAVQELTRGKMDVEFEIKEVKANILKKYPNFKVSNVDPEIRADCVNNLSRHYYQGNKDRYWRVKRGTYRLYDSEKDKIESDGATDQ